MSGYFSLCLVVEILFNVGYPCQFCCQLCARTDGVMGFCLLFLVLCFPPGTTSGQNLVQHLKSTKVYTISWMCERMLNVIIPYA